MSKAPIVNNIYEHPIFKPRPNRHINILTSIVEKIIILHNAAPHNLVASRPRITLGMYSIK